MRNRHNPVLAPGSQVVGEETVQGGWIFYLTIQLQLLFLRFHFRPALMLSSLLREMLLLGDVLLPPVPVPVCVMEVGEVEGEEILILTMVMVIRMASWVWVWVD